MKKGLIILFSIISIGINAQIIDFNNFSEKTMNEVMFTTMNNYVKKIHNGDSLIWSSVIQNEIMPDNYDFIKNNSTKQSISLHNQKWLGKLYCNDLPDTLKTKITKEMASKYPNSNFIKMHENIAFTYIENIDNIQFIGNVRPITYQSVAQKCINDWNSSYGHRIYMNANYRNGVVIGITSYFEKKTKTIIVSFVYVG